MPQPAADLTEVDLLLRLARRWRRLGLRDDAGGAPGEGADPHLTPHQERGLMALARLDHRSWGCSAEHPTGVRISRLAEHLGIAPRSATEVADALEAAGLLVRSPDPTDRRAVLLTLTDAGRHAVAEARERRRAAADTAVAALSPADRAELRRLLLSLLEAPPTDRSPAGASRPPRHGTAAEAAPEGARS